ncbi:gag-pol [Trichonephila clavipes]|nr:gag-pol [Trichonephila clavipes]
MDPVNLHVEEGDSRGNSRFSSSISQHQVLGCGGAWHLRNNCPGVNHKDLLRASVIESKKEYSHRKGSVDRNIDAPSKRPCPENSKYRWRVKKKFGMTDPVVSQVTMLSTSESNPWSDKSVHKDQQADPEIKQLYNSKSHLMKSPAGKTSPLSIL